MRLARCLIWAESLALSLVVVILNDFLNAAKCKLSLEEENEVMDEIK